MKNAMEAEMIQKNIHETALCREAQTFFKILRQPGAGQIGDAVELDVLPDGKRAVFAGTFIDKLKCARPIRICQVDLTSSFCKGPNA